MWGGCPPSAVRPAEGAGRGWGTGESARAVPGVCVPGRSCPGRTVPGSGVVVPGAPAFGPGAAVTGLVTPAPVGGAWLVWTTESGKGARSPTCGSPTFGMWLPACGTERLDALLGLGAGPGVAMFGRPLPPAAVFGPLRMSTPPIPQPVHTPRPMLMPSDSQSMCMGPCPALEPSHPANRSVPRVTPALSTESAVNAAARPTFAAAAAIREMLEAMLCTSWPTSEVSRARTAPMPNEATPRTMPKIVVSAPMRAARLISSMAFCNSSA